MNIILRRASYDLSIFALHACVKVFWCNYDMNCSTELKISFSVFLSSHNRLDVLFCLRWIFQVYYGILRLFKEIAVESVFFLFSFFFPKTLNPGRFFCSVHLFCPPCVLSLLQYRAMDSSRQQAPYHVRMDADDALKLVKQGATILLLGVPPSTSFGIDQQVWLPVLTEFFLFLLVPWSS